MRRAEPNPQNSPTFLHNLFPSRHHLRSAITHQLSTVNDGASINLAQIIAEISMQYEINRLWEFRLAIFAAIPEIPFEDRACNWYHAKEIVSHLYRVLEISNYGPLS